MRTRGRQSRGCADARRRCLARGRPRRAVRGGAVRSVREGRGRRDPCRTAWIRARGEGPGAAAARSTPGPRNDRAPVCVCTPGLYANAVVRGSPCIRGRGRLSAPCPSEDSGCTRPRRGGGHPPQRARVAGWGSTCAWSGCERGSRCDQTWFPCHRYRTAEPSQSSFTSVRRHRNVPTAWEQPQEPGTLPVPAYEVKRAGGGGASVILL
jgi:hypothetical protein